MECLIFTKLKNRMMKTRTIIIKNIENGEILMAITIIKTFLIFEKPDFIETQKSH